MKRMKIALWLLLALPLSGLAALPELTIELGEPYELAVGGWPRLKRLNNGRMLVAYCRGTGAYVRASADNGETWQAYRGERTVFTPPAGMFVGNIDFAQFPRDHAKYANRIVCALNLRANDPAKEPFHIVSCYSDDDGFTWKSVTTNFTAAVIANERGCYEPSPYINKDGNVEIYFADKSYTPQVTGNQRIARVTSSDGGVKWSAAETYCESENSGSDKRGLDGMPIMVRWKGHDYLAIETRHASNLLRPEIVVDGATYCQPFTDEVLTSINTFTGLKFKNGAAGSPYICETENYILMANHVTTSNGAVEKMTPHVNAVPKAEIGNDGLIVGKMRGNAQVPMYCGTDEFTSQGARWTVLCPLGGDEFLMVSAFAHTIIESGAKRERMFLVKGKVTGGAQLKRNGDASDSLETAGFGDTAVPGWTEQAAAVAYRGASHEKVMVVQGSAKYETANAGSVRVMDFKAQVTRPATTPAAPDGTEPLELAIDSDGTLLVAANGATAWTKLEKTLADGSWINVKATLDYAAKKLALAIDGETALAGELTLPKPDKAALTAEGACAIDDVVLTHPTGGLIKLN